MTSGGKLQGTAARASGATMADRNNTARDYPVVVLHEAFEAQVGRTPDAPAIRFRDETLTYRQLDDRADRLAGSLAQRGAGPGSLVAVCMDRSLEMVVALYAVLKAGAAYVPIDPEYPAQRISFMLDDARPATLLTQRHLSSRLQGLGVDIVSVDVLPAALEDQPGVRGSAATPDDLAYVIYTSGSTGQPKGAMISHRAISNRINWMQEAYGLTADDRVLQKTPFSFDVSVWEFFWPLLFGAQLEIAEPGGHRDTSYLARTIMERQVTTIHFVPSMLQLFLDDPQAGFCTSLRRVICSGEALPRALQDRFYQRLDAGLHNLYGPTEAAVDVTAWTCDPESELPFVPIGRPIANTQIHILDPDMRPVVVGTAGELHIGGVQVAQGYLNRPQLTAERFVDDPFSDVPGARLYKTGDLARDLPDGAIEFLGREDYQVKIRGSRVELGEVEAALEAIAGIRQAIVVAHERPIGDLELVAYVSSADAEGPPCDDIRARLAARLPEYMIPSMVVPVEAFSLTSNGKIDRKALSAPGRFRPQLDAPYTAPRTALERMIATKWRRILDLDRVGVHDRFLELGGTSLQAARFVNEMQAELGESIFVVTLFNAPTVAEYAVLLETQYPAAVSRVVEPAAAVGSRAATRAAITEDDLARFRSLVPTTAAPTTENGPRNPPAVFILSPPRSGTTLLRIMLSGHPDLFAASELQLLGFSTLQERATAYAGRFSGWLDGTVRALMQLEHVGADEAWMRMAAAEGEGLTTKQFFRRLQASAEPRMIVDKSPSYALDPAALRKARADFDGAHYIHLVRHPGAMIDSFERHHMEQVLYLGEHDFTSRQLAELVWTQSHHNILAFLDAVPADRWARVRFEDLVRDPSAQMRSLCTRLELDFHDAVLRPYDDLDDKMVDGVYTDSAPMGDPGFLAHGRIDPAAATVPASTLRPTSLGQSTRELAAGFGYDPDQSRPAPSIRRRAMVRQRGLRQSARGRPGE